MNARSTTTALLVVLAMAATAAAGDLPAQAQRVWAPTGDEVGTDNHATATLLLNDELGDEAKAAEHTSRMGDSFGSGLFHWTRTAESGHQLTARGLFGNLESSGLAGDFGLWSSSPGMYRAALTYNAHDLYYDRDGEMRNAFYPLPPAPAGLDATPHLAWRRGVLDVGFHLADGFDVSLGVREMRREGNKTSLLRGGSGDTPPQLQNVDSDLYEITVGGAYRRGAVAAELELGYLGADDTRAYGDNHAYDDERKLYSARLTAGYDVGATSRVMAAGALARLELEGVEQYDGREGVTDGDTETGYGQLAFLTRVGRDTGVRLSARFEGRNSEMRVDEAGGILYASDRQTDRMDYQLVADNRSLPRTRLRLKYRYTSTDLDEIIAEDGLIGSAAQGDIQTTNQETDRQELSFRARTRLDRKVKLKLGLKWQSVETDATTEDTEFHAVFGDYERSRLAWDVALQMRPRPNLPIDLGYQGRDQSFERTEMDAVETTYKANRLYLNTNWIATGRLTVYGMVSLGQETYEVTDIADPAAGFAAYDYDGTALRFTPGAVFQLTPAVQLEGMYEGITFEDTGSESASLTAVEADRDRVLLRARWRATDDLTASITYRRNEFDENRWDDYIQDLYAVSVSRRF